AQWRSSRVAVDSSLHRLDWQVLARPAEAPAPAGRCALVGPAWLDLPAEGEGAVRHADIAALRTGVTAGQPTPDLVVLTVPGPRDGEQPPARVHAVAQLMLDQLREWLADDGLGATRLVVATRGAVAAREGDPPADLAAASVLGMVRAVQAEHPERILLADLDAAASLRTLLAAVPAAVAADESQLA
ncbi:hypothetical protein AB4Z54_58225, partial [Streptomyces sp. MCAF7]